MLIDRLIYLTLNDNYNDPSNIFRVSCKTLLCGVGCLRFKIDINSILVCNIMQGTVKQQM